ncbi:MAG: hypothetical protein AB4352_13330 [Hormoscilla sp.]
MIMIRYRQRGRLGVGEKAIGEFDRKLYSRVIIETCTSALVRAIDRLGRS